MASFLGQWTKSSVRNSCRHNAAGGGRHRLRRLAGGGGHHRRRRYGFYSLPGRAAGADVEAALKALLAEFWIVRKQGFFPIPLRQLQGQCQNDNLLLSEEAILRNWLVDMQGVDTELEAATGRAARSRRRRCARLWPGLADMRAGSWRDCCWRIRGWPRPSRCFLVARPTTRRAGGFRWSSFIRSWRWARAS